MTTTGFSFFQISAYACSALILVIEDNAPFIWEWAQGKKQKVKHMELSKWFTILMQVSVCMRALDNRFHAIRFTDMLSILCANSKCAEDGKYGITSSRYLRKETNEY